MPHYLKTPNSGGVNIGTTSVEVLPAQGARILLIVCNPSNEGMYLTFGEDAVASEGIYLGARGGTMIFTEGDIHLPLSINAITASGSNKRLTYFEGT